LVVVTQDTMATTIKGKPAWEKKPISKLYINSVGVSNDGRSVIAGAYYYAYNLAANHTTSAASFNVGVFLWNSKGKLTWQDEFSATEGVYWVSVSGDGTRAAAGGLLSHSDGFVYAYDAATGTKELNYTASSRVNMVVLSGDGGALVAGATNLHFFTRTGSTWSAVQTINSASGDHVVAVGISDDGKWICTGTYQGHVTLYRNNNGALSSTATWQQPGGEIYWISMAGDGSGFVVGAKGAKVFYFDSGSFGGNKQPAWSVRLTGCTRCGSVAISTDGKTVSAVGNAGTAGKVFLYANQGTGASLLWSKATGHNPNSTSLDASGDLVTVADGYPDGKPGTFYLFDRVGNLTWKYKTTNMSWPAQISRSGNAVAAGSDDAYVYYFA
jgi:WD40 repeat protein